MSRRQVSPRKTRFLRCPTFLPRLGLPLRLRLPLPLPSLSVLLAAALAPLPGLRHSAPALGRRDGREVQEARGRPWLSGAKLRPPPPAAPVPERGACLIGGHTLRGRGAESLNSSPPTGRPQPSSPPPPPHPLQLPRGVGFARPVPTPSLDPPSEGASEAGQAPQPRATDLLPRPRGGSSGAGGLGHDGGAERGLGGGEWRDPAARARLRTAWGWGGSQRRARKGTKMKPPGQPSGVRERSCCWQPVSAVWCLPLHTPATDFTSGLPAPPQP